MAFRGIIDNTQSYLQSMNMMRQGLKEALGTLAEIKALKGRQVMEQNIREAMSRGPQAEWGGMDQSMATPADTLEARMARVNEAITGTRAKARPKDFLSGLLSAFNPNVPTFLETTPVEELVTRGAASEMFRDPMDRQIQQANLENIQARTGYYQQGGARTAADDKRTVNYGRWSKIRNDAASQKATLQQQEEAGSKVDPEVYTQLDKTIKRANAAMAELFPESEQPPTQEPVDAVTMASPNIPIPEPIAPLLPFDVVEMAKKLDPASKEQLIQIIKEGDPKKMQAAYERMKATYAPVR